ncbi:superoxide dismutase [Candidatus Dependentiae bacterium]|nr:superoxide dismutase [Candidatus Dependentiae bacterium]
MTYKLIPLPYAFGALEPYIDALTMEIHHDRHYQGYINKLNAALEKHPELTKKSLAELLLSLDSLPIDVRTAIRNNGGGTYNHAFFWKIMTPNGGGQPGGKLGDAIKKDFGSFDAFQDKFNTAAKTVFGSGWAWLCLDKSGKLQVISTPNQNCPISQDLIPVLGLDVWEHAYYLKYQNKRPDYITAWWHVINWEQAEENFVNV